jgi:hypothetical protein
MAASYDETWETLEVDVVSYNLLCSHQSAHRDLPRCERDACDPKKRLTRVRQKLHPHLVAGRILCLQELSRSWHDDLLPYLANYEYTLVAGLYGNARNNYMGVAVAFPHDKYDLCEVATPRVADGAKWPFQPRKTPSAASSAWAWLSSWATWWWTGSVDPNARKTSPENEIERARSRYNQLVLLRLSCRRSMRSFVVGTYHMPCAFDWPDQMRLHAAAAVSQSIAFAQDPHETLEEGDPLVLAGDFNFKPDSDCYRLVTEGRLPDDEEKLTMMRCRGITAAQLRTPNPLNSAFVGLHGEEPAFTIHSYAEWSGGPNAFTGTLDYVFHSDQFTCVWTNTLPNSPDDEFETPLPTLEEPSDHLLIHARLRADPTD